MEGSVKAAVDREMGSLRGEVTESPAVAVTIVADDDILRRRLQALLGREGFAVAHAGTLRNPLASYLEPHAVVVALGRFDGDCAAALRRIRAELQRGVVIGICAQSRTRVFREALGEGLDGLVLESDLDVSLAPALRATLAGLLVVPRKARAYAEGPVLSSREKQVLGLVVMGLSNREIGRRLFIAEATVKSHLASAFRKLGVQTRSEACRALLDPTNGLGLGVLALCDEGASAGR